MDGTEKTPGRIRDVCARYLAKNIGATGIANQVKVQSAYARGVAHPLSANVETFGTAKISDEHIAGFINDHFDLGCASQCIARPPRTVTSAVMISSSLANKPVEQKR